MDKIQGKSGSREKLATTAFWVLVGEETPPGGPTLALDLPPLNFFHESILLEDTAWTKACLQQLQRSPINVELLHYSSSLAHGAAAKEGRESQRKATVSNGTEPAEATACGAELEQREVAICTALIV
jgi:hypothetical protein